MNTKEILKKARALIAKCENWTQHQMARDKNGNGVAWASGAACSFCLLGAVYRVTDGEENEVEKAYKRLETCSTLANNGTAITYFNDHNSHAEVLALFSEALKPRKRMRPLESIQSSDWPHSASPFKSFNSKGIFK